MVRLYSKDRCYYCSYNNVVTKLNTSNWKNAYNQVLALYPNTKVSCW